MAKYSNLKITEFENAILNDPKAIILDVRTHSEFMEGHLEDAINMPNIKEHINSLDPSKHYYLHCRVGGRSAVASLILANRGFAHVYNLSDTIEKTRLSLIKESRRQSVA